jgi:hypothetical protein
MVPLPPKLTLAPYLQRWNAITNELKVNLLVMPIGDPFAPLGTGLSLTDPGPPFVGARLVVKVELSSVWQQMPGFSNVDAEQIIVLPMPSARTPLYNELAAQFKITQSEEVPVRKAELMVRTHLMSSYQNAFAFVAPRTKLAYTDSTYACLMKCPPKTPPTPVVIDDSVSWAEAFSFALRQPQLAREMGLVYELTFTLNPATLYKDGGWLFVTLDSSSDYSALTPTPDFLKSYATRVSPLSATKSYQLFTPVLFPVVEDPTVTILPGNFDEAFREVARFNDGFSKIVHGGQARFRDHLQDEGEGSLPIREEGIQLGWDNEDLVVAQNRQMGLDPTTMSEPAEAPMGVVGYRIDVRRVGESVWNSMSKLAADQFSFGSINLGPIDWEGRTEVFPAKVSEQFWLPSYFARWKGRSLVMVEPDDLLLFSGKYTTKSPYYHSVDAGAVDLKYGNKYEFRVRMVDTTNGGPALSDKFILPGEAPTCTVHFKRFVRPGPVSWPEVDPVPTQATLTQYTIARPVMELPQALFTHYPNVRTALLQVLKDNEVKGSGNGINPTIPDPDTSTLRIRVLVRTPDFDPTPITRDEEGFIEWYATTRAFSSDVHVPYSLKLTFVDCANLLDVDLSAQLGGNPQGNLTIPTAREIKIELAAIGKDDPDYFGTERARNGATSYLKLYRPATSEEQLFLTQLEQDTIQSIYLQPTHLEQSLQPTAKVLQNIELPLLVQRLASATKLVAHDTTLMMPPGERGIFGCAKEFKHYLPANNSSIVFMSPGELAHCWTSVIHYTINRDWSWKGFDAPTFIIEREITLVGNNYSESRHIVGEVKMMHAVAPLIAEEALPDRGHSTFVFVDGFKPYLGTDGKPYEVNVKYFITMRCDNGDEHQVECGNHLPVVTPPRQVPKVVSAGIALSPYVIGKDYATTGTRQRMLWLEFEELPQDSRDTYFIRVLTHTADPMLLQSYRALEGAAGYEEWSLDPELIRVITPGQSDDFAGLTTMQRLISAQDSNRHYLVALPPGTYPDSPELFGFYTYEIRIGHDQGTLSNPFWSTAQGRFGTALILEGVQHPAPPLSCNVTRINKVILASSAFAQPYAEGVNLQAVPPQTELWFVLYARVVQADGAIMRNIELDKRRGEIFERRRWHEVSKKFGISTTASIPTVSESFSARGVIQNIKAPLQGHVLWSDEEVEELLRFMGLPTTTPLSVIGIELLPEPNGKFYDPLGGNLGEVRILRTSSLQEVEGRCC